jgi:hypothetical protein
VCATKSDEAMGTIRFDDLIKVSLHVSSSERAIRARLAL